jgi:hypothetical protein
MNTLSKSALSLLREYRGDITVDDSNREACRELASQGLLVVGHTFTGGREVFYRCTEMGAKLVGVLERGGITALKPAESASPRS